MALFLEIFATRPSTALLRAGNREMVLVAPNAASLLDRVQQRLDSSFAPHRDIGQIDLTRRAA